MIEKIINHAKNEGFEAAVLETSKLEFDFSFRKYCEQNLCGNFGKSEYCPPLCPSAEDLKSLVLAHKNIIVLRSAHNISDIADGEKIKVAQCSHNAATLRLIEKFPYKISALALASGEGIEAPTGVTAACLSAYCINVSQMAQSCNMPYAYKDGILPLFGFIILE